MLNDPKYHNAFIVNNIPIPEPNEYTNIEDNERLLHERISPLDFYTTYQVRHEYKSIILPLLEEQQYDNTPPPPPPARPHTYQSTITDLWEQICGKYKEWSEYPEIWTNRAYEYMRHYLASRNYLNVSPADMLISEERVGVVRGFAVHPHLPIIALATPTAVAVCAVPISSPVPRLLYHERVRGIKCVAFRPNAGNTLAVGYDDGIAIFTQKDEIVAKTTTCLDGYHAGSSSWVHFLSEPTVGAVTSMSWDSCGEYIMAGSAVSGKVGVWRIVGNQFSLLSYTGPVEFVLWSPFNDFLFTAHVGGILNFWDKTNKQEITRMETQAAAFSPDGKYVAIATSNLYIYSLSHDKKEIVKCVFVEPAANVAREKLTGDKVELGVIENIAWSHDGQRIGISFSALPMVALYCVRKLNDSFSLRPIGYVNPTSFSPEAPPHIDSIAFIPNAERGSVLCVCYSNAIVTFTPLFYHTISPTKNQRVIIPSIRPVVFSQPAPPNTPLPISPIPSDSPISPGHLLTPSKAPGYKVLFDNLRSPVFA